MSQLTLIEEHREPPNYDRDKYLPGDRGDPPRRAGVIQPRRFSAVTWLRAVPGVLSFFSEEVPSEFWVRDVDKGGAISVVSCPCGGEVVVPNCELAGCSCGRRYFNVVDRILVGRE